MRPERARCQGIWLEPRKRPRDLKREKSERKSDSNYGLVSRGLLEQDELPKRKLKIMVIQTLSPPSPWSPAWLSVLLVGLNHLEAKPQWSQIKYIKQASILGHWARKTRWEYPWVGKWMISHTLNLFHPQHLLLLFVQVEYCISSTVSHLLLYNHRWC